MLFFKFGDGPIVIGSDMLSSLEWFDMIWLLFMYSILLYGDQILDTQILDIIRCCLFLGYLITKTERCDYHTE